MIASVILGILKVIGMILLAVLALLLLSILALLFVPLRYKLAGKGGEGLWEGRADASWLFHLISITAEYVKKEGTIQLKLFGIPIKRFGGSQEKARKEEKNSDLPDSVDEQPPVHKVQAEHKEKTRRKPTRKPTSGDKSGAGRKVFAAMQELPDKLTEIKTLFQEDARELYSRLLGQLRYLWIHYRPEEIKGWLRFGTGAPDVTGELTGLIYLLLPPSAEQMELIPDFTEKVLEGDVKLKGHIRICHLLRAAFLLWRDKKFRKLLRRIRNR